MKIAIFFSSVLYSFNLFAFNGAEIQIKSANISQIFKIKNERKKSFLSFSEESRKKIKTINLSPSLTEDLISEAHRITWKAAYRKPTSQMSCNVYATFIIDKSKSENICFENKLATGHAYGFLNKLNKMLQNP